MEIVLPVWTVVLEKTLESPLDYKEIQPVHSIGEQSWMFFGRTDAEAETPILWPPHEKSWLTEKYPDTGRHWGQEEKGTTEDEMAGWHHWLDGRESCHFSADVGQSLDRDFPKCGNNSEDVHDITNSKLWSWKELF